MIDTISLPLWYAFWNRDTLIAATWQTLDQNYNSSLICIRTAYLSFAVDSLIATNSSQASWFGIRSRRVETGAWPLAYSPTRLGMQRLDPWIVDSMDVRCLYSSLLDVYTPFVFLRRCLGVHIIWEKP